MSVVPQITELERVIEPHLEDGAQLVSYKSKYLTKPGDNYGSIMLSIDATVRSCEGSLEKLPLIAKLPPIMNELYWQIFQPERTCVSENAIYQHLAPELRKLEREAGIAPQDIFDAFPRYYGSRISLDATATTVDHDAVLVQENLQISGYKSPERLKPYDLEHTVLILRQVARYHALPIALRLQKPAIFDEFVRPYFRKFNMTETLGKEATHAIYEQTLTDIKAITNNNEADEEHVRQLFQLYDDFQAVSEVPDGPYTTIVHSDLWINNIMIKYADDGRPQELKLIDFQMAQFESLVHDVIFLLLSSVDTTVLEQHYHDFLNIYYEAFIESLRSVNVNTDDVYSLENFLAEVKRVAFVQVPHALFMTKVILADNSTLPEDFKDMDLSVMSKNTGILPIKIKLGEIVRLSKKFDILD